VLDLAAAFTTQASRVGATVLRASRATAASVAGGALQEAGCRSVALAESLPEREALVVELDALGLALRSSAELWPTRRADGGVSLARLGVAETGSLLLHSPSVERRVELCVDHHLVLLDVRRIVATLEPAFAALAELARQPPAYATLVSGPSRSADIERTLTIGVHGPRTLTILLLEGE
jgi:L-lactate dehydrogenase complex protein LldG